MGFNSSLKTDYRESMYLLLLQQVPSITRNSESSKPLPRKSLFPSGAKGRWWANLRELDNVCCLSLVVTLKPKGH